MPAPIPPTIDIVDCSRGLSDFYPARLAIDQLTAGWDVEFWNGAVCGRRLGSSTKVSGGTASQVQEGLFVTTPTTAAADNRLLRASGAVPGVVTLYDAAYSASTPTITPADNFDFRLGVDAASVGGKTFIAGKSDVDRLHVLVGGTLIRRTGLAAPAAPSVADQGSGFFSGARQYRVRFTQQVTGVTTLRSEPSPATAFTPSGSGAAARITRPSAVNEAETNWEVEEIAPNGLWYRIATVAIATTTYDDTLGLSQIATSGILSADVGEYTLEYSARYLAVDEDRLLLGGSFNSEQLSARVSWSALGSNPNGVGNYERLQGNLNPYLDFDTLDGGGLTALKAWEGKVIVFKMGQVHQMIRTSSPARAYLPDCISRRHGALPGSVVEGTDVDGLSCLYFLDRNAGPMQLGFKGLRVLAPELQRTWQSTVNFNATQVACVGFHSEKRQVWWHVAMGAATKPSQRWMYTVDTDGLVYATIPNPVRAVAPWNGKPHMLLDNPGGVVIVMGDDPLATTDYGSVLYRAYVKTKAFQQGGLLRRFGLLSAVLEVGALASTDVSLKFIRDFGLETRSVTVSCAPSGAEAFVAIPIDNAYLMEAITQQIEIGDLTAVDENPWQVHGLCMAYQLGSPSTGQSG